MGSAGVILRKIAAVFKKDTITALRQRNGFVFTIAAQAAQLAAFYYLSRAVGPQFRPEGMPYFLFLLAGTGFYTFLLAGPYSFLRMIQEAQQSGTLEALLISATPPAVLVTLGAISAFAANLLQLFVYLGAGILLTTSHVSISLVGFALVLLLSIVIAFAVGLFAAGLQISIQKGSALLWLLGSGVWLVSGALFPVSALPRTAQIFSSAIPFTHSLSGIRLALFHENPPALVREIQLLALFCLLLVPVSLAFFSWSLRRAQQDGTLALY